MDEKRQNTEQQSQTSKVQGKEQKMAENPNPRANENIQQTGYQQDNDKQSNEVGSEITDGEDA